MDPHALALHRHIRSAVLGVRPTNQTHPLDQSQSADRPSEAVLSAPSGLASESHESGTARAIGMSGGWWVLQEDMSGGRAAAASPPEVPEARPALAEAGQTGPAPPHASRPSPWGAAPPPAPAAAGPTGPAPPLAPRPRHCPPPPPPCICPRALFRLTKPQMHVRWDSGRWSF
jgi:hypothetical protein